MGPEVMEASTEAVRSRLTSFLEVDPEHRAWIRQSPEDESCIVVGSLASQLQAQTALKKMKAATAVAKARAMLGVICSQLGYLGYVDKLELLVLLPWNEYQQSKAIEERLRNGLQEFYFGEHQVKFKLDRLKILPEGYGLVQLGKFNQEKKAGLRVAWMMGFRNAGLVMCDAGKSPTGATSVYGLWWVVDKLLGDYGLTDRLELARIIDRVHGRKLTEAPELRALASRLCGTVGEQKEFQTRLLQSIDRELESYWNLLWQWFQENVNEPLSSIAIAGGTSVLFEAKIAEYFPGVPLMRGEDWREEIEEILKRSTRIQEKHELMAEAIRCVDVLGVGRLFRGREG